MAHGEAPTADLLVTGAAGRVATALRPALRSRYSVRLTDVRELRSPVGPDESYLRGDLTDRSFAMRATRGVRSILHLAGETRPEASWHDLLTNSLSATVSLLAASTAQRVPRMVYASSVHATGGYNDPRSWPVQTSALVRPCCRYGAIKAAGEVLMQAYGDEVAGSHVVCLRLALVTHPVRWRDEVSGWLADTDLCALVLAALEAKGSYGIYYGASNSDQPRYDLRNAQTDLGYVPRVHASGSGLTAQRPAYAANCRLWRQGGEEQGDPESRIAMPPAS